MNPKAKERSQAVEFGVAELYDLEADVGEQYNLADKHPEIVERLAKRMADFHAEKEKNLRPAGSAGAN